MQITSSTKIKQLGFDKVNMVKKGFAKIQNLRVRFLQIKIKSSTNEDESKEKL